MRDKDTGKRIRHKAPGRGNRRQAQHAPYWQARTSCFCTGCHTFRRVKVHVTRIEEKLDAMLPAVFEHRETRCVKGHASEFVYVANRANKNRFGISGSY